MAEFAQVMHGWPVPGHSLSPQLIKRIIVGRDVPATSGAAGTVVFSDIPQHYAHLGLRLIAQSSSTASTEVISLECNPESGVSISGMQSQLRHVASTTVAGTSSALAPTNFGIIVGSNVSNGLTAPGVTDGMIYGYSSTYWRYKSWMFRSYTAPSTSNTAAEQYFYGGRIDMGSLNVVITSLRITLAAASFFLPNSQFELIGHP
jgi:hypothetical protein